MGTRISSRKIYVIRKKLSGEISAVTNLGLLSNKSGLRPGTTKRVFGGESDLDYYEDGNLTITIIKTDNIERGNQRPPQKEDYVSG